MPWPGGSARDPDVTEVICAPGNPGMAGLRSVSRFDSTDPGDVLALAAARTGRPDGRRPGSAPRRRGWPTLFRHAGRPIIGPSRQGAAARVLEGLRQSTSWRATASRPPRFAVVRDARRGAGRDQRRPIRLPGRRQSRRPCRPARASSSRRTARKPRRPCARAMVDAQFGAAGARVVIEECLTGPEVSFFVLCDGERARAALGSAQDHKRIWDDDRGPNTGGMGAFAPSPLMTPTLEAVRHARHRRSRSSTACARTASRTSGFLYVSLMLTPTARRSSSSTCDSAIPKRRSLLPLIEGGFAGALLAAATGELDGARARRSRRTNVRRRRAGVARISGHVRDQGKTITGLEAAAAGRTRSCFTPARSVQRRRDRHGRRARADGGRPRRELRGSDGDRAYAAVDEDSRSMGMQFRRDIGRKALADRN